MLVLPFSVPPLLTSDPASVCESAVPPLNIVPLPMVVVPFTVMLAEGENVAVPDSVRSPETVNAVADVDFAKLPLRIRFPYDWDATVWAAPLYSTVLSEAIE